MTNPETLNNSNAIHAGQPPYCGTATTPPCPAAIFLRTRADLIEQLAGPGASAERLREAAAHVDDYLDATVRNIAVLARASFERIAVRLG